MQRVVCLVRCLETTHLGVELAAMLLGAPFFFFFSFGCSFRFIFWSLISCLRDSGLFFLQPLVCAKVFTKFYEDVVLTNPSLLVCSGLDAMSRFSRWSGIPASPSGLWCGDDAWVFCFFLAGFAPEI
jgi:hypothetical protein